MALKFRDSNTTWRVTVHQASQLIAEWNNGSEKSNIDGCNADNAFVCNSDGGKSDIDSRSVTDTDDHNDFEV